jgi:fatty-acid desaturase
MPSWLGECEVALSTGGLGNHYLHFEFREDYRHPASYLVFDLSGTAKVGQIH